MVSIIKNQILKHLSKFAKNLSANSINLSALRGEGELYNLELNEEVLTELLELPNWMKISSAFVNKVSLKIQWTKLKSTPIHMSLDEVHVLMETCSEPRTNSAASTGFTSYSSGNKYGFVDKVIDGMTVSVNAIIVKFVSQSFSTTLHLQRISLCSKSPNWQPSDLRMTRLKDLNQQHVLIFKELSWQTLKIEARSTDETMTPLRLITNKSCCRLTVKKKLSDCSVVGCRLVLLTDNILWVLTDSQLLSAYHLIESLSGLIKKATEESQKTKAARKLESSSSYLSNSLHNLGTPASPQGCHDEKPSSYAGYVPPHAYVDQYNLQKFQIFKKFDVVETSYHFFSENIDLHFCDDEGAGRSCHPQLKHGATLQLVINNIKIDYYPYHLALGDRSHWIRYQEGMAYEWTKHSLNHFKNDLIDFFQSNKMSHIPLSRASPHVDIKQGHYDDNKFSDDSFPTKSFVINQYKRLMSTCCLLTCKDIVVYQVARSSKKSVQEEMLTSDKTRLCLPDNTNFLNIEFSSYYYPGGFSFPVPAPKIYTLVNPVKIIFDPMSCLWLNAFACHLMEKTSHTAPAPPYMDIHTQILMSRVIVEPHLSAEKKRGRPKALQILTSRLEISNVRPPDPTSNGSKWHLFTLLEEAQKGQLFYASGFPAQGQDRQPVPHKFLSHAEGSDIIETCVTTGNKNEAEVGYRPDTLWSEPRDIFFFHFDPIWLEFLDKPSSQRSETMVEAFSLSLWVYIKELSIDSHVNRPHSKKELSEWKSKSISSTCVEDSNDRQEASLHALAYAPNLINVQLNHLQFVFLMRLLDTVNEFLSFFTQDAKNILSKDESFLISAIVPLISASLIIPPVESSLDLSQSQTHIVQEDPGLNSCIDEDLISNLTTSSPPLSLSEESKNPGLSSMGMSHSDGCLSQSAAITQALSNTKNEIPEVAISKSGEELNSGLERKNSLSQTQEKRISVSSMKKGFATGFTSLLNSIESTVKYQQEDDSVSIQSDISNDSDKFIMLYLENDLDHGSESVFKIPSTELPVEAATEVTEEPTSSEPSIISHRPSPNIGVISFQLGNSQIIVEGQGHNSTMKFLASSISCEETPNIALEEFKNKFRSKNNCDCPMNPCSIKLRLNTAAVPNPPSPPPDPTDNENYAPKDPLSLSNVRISNKEESYAPSDKCLQGRYTCRLPVKIMAHVDIVVNNVSMSFLNSSLAGLADVFLDELVPEPLPVKVKLENVDIRLKEKKKLDEIVTKISIPKLSIIRDANSDITLLPLYLIPNLDSSTSNLSMMGSDYSLSEGRKQKSCEDVLRNELEQVRQELKKLQGDYANLNRNMDSLLVGADK